MTRDITFEEVVADSMESMLKSGNVVETMALLKQQDKSLWQKIVDWFKDLAEDLKKLVNAYQDVKPDSVEGKMVEDMQDVIVILESLYADALIDAGENYKAVGAQKNTTQEGGLKYSLSENARTELHEALYDRKYRGDVLLRDYTPGIITVQKGVRDLPMVMKISHIRENVFTEDEARSFGLKISPKINYHGLGEDLFLDVIDGLDSVTEAYRGTKHASDPVRGEKYFLLISKLSDKEGNIINVPVYIDQHGDVNRVLIDTNKISTVYGKRNLREYISREVSRNNLVRIKNKSTIPSERNAPIALDYGKDASNRIISDSDYGVNTKTEEKAISDIDREIHKGKLLSDRDYTDAEYGSIVSQLSEVRTELREAEKERKALLSNGDLLDAMYELMMAEKRTPEYKAAKQKFEDLQEELHAKEIEDRYNDLKEKEQALEKQEKEAYTSIANQKEQKAIERSGLTEGEYFRKAALKEYGYTASIADAGYLLPNGKFLNFSGEKGKSFGVRGLDHRNIGTIFEATSGTAAMIRFMNGGNIRVMAESPGLDIYAGSEPTKEQYASIKKMVREYAGKRFFVVDLSDENGRSVGNYTYEGNVNADRVVNDIKYFFENGKVRQQSSIAQFLSERDAGAERVAETLRKENGKLKEDVKHLKELLKLQRSVTNGTKFTQGSIEAAASDLMKSVGIKRGRAELAGLLETFYDSVVKYEKGDISWEDIAERAQPVVDWLMENQVEKHELDGFAQDVLRDIRGSRFYLDDQQKQNVAYKYGSYNEFRKRMMGTAVVSDKANMSLDSWWHDMAGQYPSIFDETISSSDMPEAFADAIDRLRSMEIDPYGYDFDREMMARDIMYQIREAIPYDGDMALEEGELYSQDGAVYRCTWSSGIPVHDPLADLVGLYVEVVS